MHDKWMKIPINIKPFGMKWRNDSTKLNVFERKPPRLFIGIERD